MKKHLSAILIAVLVLLCAGCGDISLPDRFADTTEPELQTTQEVLPVPDEAAVRNAFDKAVEVYGWFDLCSLDSDSADTVEYGGETYNRVVSDAVPSYDALRTLVYDLFDTATGDALLREDSETPPYIDVNGSLYALDFARGVDMSRGAYTLSVEVQNSSAILCRVTVETLEYDADADEYRHVNGSEDLLYHYQRVGQRWVFTDFSLFY
ncbi:MAG: hypothetical protein IJT41_06125 [Clostridia bacterium]|nr:hypothetical protein [Clostridia bacterium]